MNAYVRSKARSEVKSEINHVLCDPFRKMEERWDQWFNSLTSAQQIFVVTENQNPESPGYGPDRSVSNLD